MPQNPRRRRTHQGLHLHIRLPSQSWLNPHTLSMWKYETNSITFTLVVDNFGVKYSTKTDANHLIQALKKQYKPSIFTGTTPNAPSYYLFRVTSKQPSTNSSTSPQHAPNEHRMFGTSLPIALKCNMPQQLIMRPSLIPKISHACINSSVHSCTMIWQ